MNAAVPGWIKEELSQKVSREVFEIEFRNITNSLNSMDKKLGKALSIPPHTCIQKETIDEIKENVKECQQARNSSRVKTFITILSTTVVLILAGLGSAYAYGQFTSEMKSETVLAKKRIASIEKHIEVIPEQIEEACTESSKTQDNTEVIHLLQEVIKAQEELKKGTHRRR